MSRPNSKKHSGNKIEIKIELTYAFPNRIPVWGTGRSVLNKKVLGKIVEKEVVRQRKRAQRLELLK